jgi:hypothetical protein
VLIVRWVRFEGEQQLEESVRSSLMEDVKLVKGLTFFMIFMIDCLAVLTIKRVYIG